MPEIKITPNVSADLTNDDMDMVIDEAKKQTLSNLEKEGISAYFNGLDRVGPMLERLSAEEIAALTMAEALALTQTAAMDLVPVCGEPALLFFLSTEGSFIALDEWASEHLPHWDELWKDIEKGDAEAALTEEMDE